MASVHDTIRDLGPEFARRFSREMFRIARTADRFTRAELVQAEVDRLNALTDEEAAHASLRA